MARKVQLPRHATFRELVESFRVATDSLTVASALVKLAKAVAAGSGRVVAVKKGYFTNGAADVGQYECERTIKIVLTLESSGHLVGTMEFECDWVAQNKKDHDSDRVDFGDINKVNVKKIEDWAEKEFTGHRMAMRWKRGWAGPRGAGKYNLKKLIEAVRSGETREEDTDEFIDRLEIDDFIVLLAVASFKSSYMGIRDYRRYEAAKGRLIMQGYLNRRGALMNKGKEALAAMREGKHISLHLRKR